MRRAQLSLSLLEAAVGVLLVFAVTTTFTVGVPPPAANGAQLDAYAEDTAVLLANEPGPRLAGVVASRANFTAERDALADRAEQLLPAAVLYRIETPRGSLGYPRPAGVTAGVARVGTPDGTVTVWTWYA